MSDVDEARNFLRSSISKTIVESRKLADMFHQILSQPGLRVAYFTQNSATEPEQCGLVYGDKGTVIQGNGSYLVQVQWDKGFTHWVSNHNLRLLELLEELCDDPPSQV